MKIRTGFVSNSSSSSFIVGFKKRPKSTDEVHRLLFGSDEPSYIEEYGYGLSTLEIAHRVFSDIKDQKPATEKQIVECAGTGWFPGHPEWHYNAESESKLLAKQFEKQFPGVEYWATDKIKDKEAKKLAKKIHAAQRKEWDVEEKNRKDALTKYVKSILPKFKKLEVFLFSYSDNDGEALMEHGDIFHKLPHETISCH